MLSRDPVTGDRRQRTRYPVHWEARCNTRDRMCIGLLRDVNARGGFFEIQEDEAAVARRPLAEGDSILVRYIAEPSCRWVTVRAVVRWVGSSVEHQCRGIGFQFTGPVPRDPSGVLAS